MISLSDVQILDIYTYRTADFDVFKPTWLYVVMSTQLEVRGGLMVSASL